MSDAMTEFRITSDLSAIRQQVITANFEEILEWLTVNLEPYRRMTVTEDVIPTAKAYRANIRKVRERIDACRKEAKAAALAVYTPFEDKCKSLTGLCDEAATALDVQIKDFENREADEKVDRIHAEYAAMTDEEISDFLPWGCVNNPKWRNKGYSFEDAVSEVKAAVEKTRGDIAAIRDMGGEDTAYLLDVYKQTRDLSAVIRKASEIKTRRKAEEERERLEAERRAAREREKGDADSHGAARLGMTVQGTEDAPDMEETVTVDFRVTCTKAQLAALGQYMRENGIKYGRCE